jgi:hypothetical protein
MGELQLLWSCTVGAPLAVRRARNRNPGGWVFWDSRVSIWPPPRDANPTQVMLPVFTSIAGILAGFISGRASAGG